MSAPLRLVIISPSNLGPYHLRRYNGLADGDCELRIACCPLSEHDRPWRFAEESANFAIDHPFSGSEHLSRVEIARHAKAYLEKVRPHAVIVVGYGSRYTQIFATISRLNGLPTILRLAGVFDASRTRVLREIAKQAICRSLFTGVIVPGVLSAKYARLLGFSVSQIARVGNVVENTHFSDDTPVSARAKNEFIYVGRLSEEKNLHALIQAFRQYRRAGGTWSLNVVGDGPERENLVRQAAGEAAIEFYGWASYEEIPALLSQASAFVLPSVYEPWGLVANEAMAAGLPVLISRQCGCYPELCREGSNGFHFDPGDIDELCMKMHDITALNDADLDAMGETSRAIISSFSIDSWARAIRSFVTKQCASFDVAH